MMSGSERTRQPDVTVIVPFRNRDLRRLRKAVESVFGAAPESDVEVIVSDFGSDDTEAVRATCESLGARWLRTESDYWSRSECVNRALAVSNGEYVQIHDVDMMWAPGGLALQLDSIRDRPQSFISSQVWDLPEDLTDWVLTTDALDWQLLRARATSHSRWGHGLVLARRLSFLRVGGLDERMHTYGGEDLDLTKRLKKSGLRQEWAGLSGDELFHIWHEKVAARTPTDEHLAAAIRANRDLYHKDDTVVRNAGSLPESDTPLVSVVIATRNRLEYLVEAISSVLYQTVRNIEVVVVDDGSTDDTDAAVRGIDDPRVRYVRQEPSGVAAARNLGTRESRGFYIAVLDDDDIMRPDRLEIQLRYMDGTVHACVGNLLHFYDSSGETYYFSDAHPSAEGALPRGGFAGHPSWLVEKRLLEQIPYDETLTSAVDSNVALRALRSGFRFRHCNHFVTLRRIHDGQVTAVDSQRQKLGARLTHVWFRSGVDPDTMRAAAKVAPSSVERAEDPEVSAASLKPWLPDHLVSRTVRLQPSALLEDSVLPLPHRSHVAVSILNDDGEEIGVPIEMTGVTWPQLAVLRRRGIVHQVVVGERRQVDSKYGLALAAPQEPAGTDTARAPRAALDEAAVDLIESERLKLGPHEFLVCWEHAEDPAMPRDGGNAEVDRTAARYSLSNGAGTYCLFIQRCSSFEELLTVVGQADGLTTAYSSKARLHLSYIHRRAIEMGMSA